jgi:hypothetical protein
MMSFDQVEKNIQQGAEYVQNKVKEAMPKVTFNKNGYEIRTQVLDMAKQWTEFEYSQKFVGWDVTQKRDPNSGEIVTKVGMPEIPGVDQVLETAEKFYNFINNNNSK